jgi:hypothetical protein
VILLDLNKIESILYIFWVKLPIIYNLDQIIYNQDQIIYNQDQIIYNREKKNKIIYNPRRKPVFIYNQGRIMYKRGENRKKGENEQFQ